MWKYDLDLWTRTRRLDRTQRMNERRCGIPSWVWLTAQNWNWIRESLWTQIQYPWCHSHLRWRLDRFHRLETGSHRPGEVDNCIWIGPVTQNRRILTNICNHAIWYIIVLYYIYYLKNENLDMVTVVIGVISQKSELHWNIA